MLPDDLLAQIDRVARDEGINRSKLLRKAFLTYSEIRNAQSQQQLRQDDIQKAMAIQDQLRQDVPSWDPQRALQEQREET